MLFRKEDRIKECKKVVVEFKERLNAKVKRQEKIDKVKDRDFRREELLEKYNNRKFEVEYLRKLEKNWQKWKGNIRNP